MRYTHNVFLTTIAADLRSARLPIPLVAFLDGVRTVALRPHVLLATYVATLVVVMPMSVAIAGMLRNLIQSTPLAEETTRSVPLAVWDAIGRQSNGLASTFTPAILGIAAPLDNVSAMLEGRTPVAAIMAAAAAYGCVWILLWGGVIGALARGWHGWHDFVRSGVRSAGPVAVLTIGALVIYAALYLVVHPILLPRQELAAGGEVSTAVRMLAFGGLLIAVNVFVDFARVRLVLGGGSAVRSAAATVRFVRQHGAAVIGLSMLNILPLAAALGGYAAFEVIVRGVPSMWSAIVVGHLYVVARLAARLITTAAQVHLWQRLESGR